VTLHVYMTFDEKSLTTLCKVHLVRVWVSAIP